MAFDARLHQETLRLIEVGKRLRLEKGLQPERNVTILYHEGAASEGKEIVNLTSKKVDHLPAPHEMKDEKGDFEIPNKPCPECGKITFLYSICQSCVAAEGGKYKTGYTCDKRFGGCGFVDDKTDEFLMQRLSRMKKEGTFKGELPQGMKQDIGIETLTDDGLK